MTVQFPLRPFPAPLTIRHSYGSSSRPATAPPRSLLALLATLQPIHEALPPIPELPTNSMDL